MAELILSYSSKGVRLLALAGLVAGPCFGQRIEGTVSNQQGAPVEDVSLQWIKQEEPCQS